MTSQNNARLRSAGSPSLPVDGPERASLQRLTRRLGLCARLKFAGHFEDIGPLLGESAVFLLPSPFEGNPAALIEALATGLPVETGLPVVTTPCSPAMREIVSDPSFGRIATADPISEAAAILSLEHSAGPDSILLRPLLDQHRLSLSAEDWLHCLDAIVRRDGAQS